MSRESVEKSFSVREIDYLNSLPAVEHATKDRIRYTSEFRRECMRLYAQGESPVRIFRSAGLDPALIGYKRIERCIARWKGDIDAMQLTSSAMREGTSHSNKEERGVAALGGSRSGEYSGDRFADHPDSLSAKQLSGSAYAGVASDAVASVSGVRAVSESNAETDGSASKPTSVTRETSANATRAMAGSGEKAPNVAGKADNVAGTAGNVAGTADNNAGAPNKAAVSVADSSFRTITEPVKFTVNSSRRSFTHPSSTATVTVEHTSRGSGGVRVFPQRHTGAFHFPDGTSSGFGDSPVLSVASPDRAGHDNTDIYSLIIMQQARRIDDLEHELEDVRAELQQVAKARRVA